MALSSYKDVDWMASYHRASGIISQSVTIDIHVEMCSARTTRDVGLSSRPYQQSSRAQAISTYWGEHTIQEFTCYLQTQWCLKTTMEKLLYFICTAHPGALEQCLIRDQDHLYQFLMHLLPEFEAICG